MSAPAHFHDAHDALQPALERDIPLHDDGIGEKGRAVRAEAQVRIAVLHLRRHHHRDAHPREHRDHAIERLPEVLAKRRRQGQLEPRKRIDHQPPRFVTVNGFNNLVEHFIDGEIQRPRLDDAHFACADELIEPSAAGTILRVLVGALLEHRNDARLIVARALADELAGQHALAGARRSGEQHRVAGRNAAAEHLVQSFHADREPLPGGRALPTCPRRPFLILWPDDDPREHLQTVVRDTEGVQTGNGRLPAHLDDLHLANHGIAIEALHEPQQPVRDGEDRILLDLRRSIFADEKRGRFPACEPDGQLLHEVLQIEAAARRSLHSLGHRSKRIDDHHARAGRFHFLDDACQKLLQRSVHQVLAQVDVADRLVHSGHIEEAELLLIAQHLEGRLADDGNVERGTGGAGQGEHDLLRERRLPRAGSAGNDIERELRHTATQNLVEPRNARGKPADGNSIGHALGSSELASERASGHAFRNRRIVNGSPMNVASNPVKVANTALAASVATAGSCRFKQMRT